MRSGASHRAAMQNNATNSFETYLENLLKNNPRLAVTPPEFGSFFGRSGTWALRKLYEGRIKKLRGDGRILIPIAEAVRLAAELEAHGGARTEKKKGGVK